MEPVMENLTPEERKLHFGSLYGLRQGEFNGIARAKIGAPRFRLPDNPPSIVDRIGALGDPGLAKQVERYDRMLEAYAKLREEFNKHSHVVPDAQPKIRKTW